MTEADDRFKKLEVRLEKIEDRRQKSDIRSKMSDCFLSSVFYLPFSFVCLLTSDFSGIQ